MPNHEKLPKYNNSREEINKKEENSEGIKKQLEEAMFSGDMDKVIKLAEQVKALKYQEGESKKDEAIENRKDTEQEEVRKGAEGLAEMKMLQATIDQTKLKEIRAKIENGTKEEIQVIYEELKKKEELADAARIKNNRDQYDWSQIKLEEKYNLAVQDRREAEILSDPDVQRFAEEFSGITSEEARRMTLDLRQQIGNIIRKYWPGQRSPENQKAMDLISKKKSGINIAANGGLEQSVTDFKKRLEKSIDERLASL